LSANDIDSGDWDAWEQTVLAGLTYTIDEQCQFKYGAGSGQCGEVVISVFENIR